MNLKYDETDETRLLNSLKLRPIKQESSERLSCLENSLKSNTEAKPNAHTETTLFESKNLKLKITVNEEDSDDDLIPFDTSNDLPLSKLKKPAYLRDCLNGK